MVERAGRLKNHTLLIKKKERPLLVAWQRPLLRTTERQGTGPGAVKSASHRLLVTTVISITRSAIGSPAPEQSLSH